MKKPSRRAARAPRSTSARRRQGGQGEAGGRAALDAMARDLEHWFSRNARELPWRTTPRDPWCSLVAEAMLQQTQVSRVAGEGPGTEPGAFARFVARFPTPAALASADEAEVMALWAGLGYYRRARHLHAAARAIVERHGGRVPDDPAALRALPGVGRYTAGAIASIVFGRREPIVDGNVRRVLLRVAGNDADPASRDTETWAWAEAARFVAASARPGAFNEGLMELGATVCLPAPASPRCEACPWARACRARALGLEDRIPRAKRPPRRGVLHLLVVVVRDGRGRLLLERRGPGGLWPGLWQPPTLESKRTIGPAQRESFLAGLGLGASGVGGGGGAGGRGGRGGRGGEVGGGGVGGVVARFTRDLTHLTVHVQAVVVEVDRAAAQRLVRRSGLAARWCMEGAAEPGMSSLHARAVGSARIVEPTGHGRQG